MKLNNKGQTLVVFIILLPIILMIIALIMQTSYLEITKREYENTIKDTINYGLDHIDDENINQKLLNLLDHNIEGTKKVEINNNKIRIQVISEKQGMFSKIFDKTYQIDITYTGYLNNNQKIIKKN